MILPRVVVDIGNTRMKWGLVRWGSPLEAVALPAGQPEAWQRQFDEWHLDQARWTVASVHPERRERFVAWLSERSLPPRVLASHWDLPLAVAVDNPDRVGIDRLLNAVAAAANREPGMASIVVDAGSAVTVDLVDADGVFRGGAIFPGLRLMAQALHDHTAQLPLVRIERVLDPPGLSTDTAIASGVIHAVLGGIERCARVMDRDNFALLLLTGGDAPLLAPALPQDRLTVWPEMTLAGIEIATREA